MSTICQSAGVGEHTVFNCPVCNTVKPVKLWASGGITNYSDYLMSDGSIRTIHVPSGEIVSTVWTPDSIRPRPETEDHDEDPLPIL